MHWVFTLNKREGKKESIACFFSLSRVMEMKQSQRREGSGEDFEPLFDKPFCYVSVGDLDLLVAGTCVGELLTLVGIVQVSPDARHVFRDLKASVLLCHHLQTEREIINW